ncbi:Uncharacterized protein APZ42_008969 [Daphnia magna]|uniref:Uncharacterized protein n=1 Tax=Daphnia magna TaxID=35525 RepID=A0A164EAN8_9CRUS|nr:Uncharacterized protein APZ42_008969 [Daphnia magna]
MVHRPGNSSFVFIFAITYPFAWPFIPGYPGSSFEHFNQDVSIVSWYSFVRPMVVGQFLSVFAYLALFTIVDTFSGPSIGNFRCPTHICNRRYLFRAVD